METRGFSMDSNNYKDVLGGAFAIGKDGKPITRDRCEGCKKELFNVDRRPMLALPEGFQNRSSEAYSLTLSESYIWTCPECGYENYAVVYLPRDGGGVTTLDALYGALKRAGYIKGNEELRRDKNAKKRQRRAWRG